MGGIMEKLAGNKVIANMAFGQLKKHIRENNISFIAIFVDGNNDISAKEYNEPMAIIKDSDYKRLIEENKQLKQQLQNGKPE